MKKHKEFSKLLLIQESALMWVTTIGLIALAFVCVFLGYTGSIPWLTAMVGLPWTAYGVSQGFYYNKSKAENTAGGIIYEKAIREGITRAQEQEEVIYDDNIDPFGQI